jgi:hypothetical protein
MVDILVQRKNPLVYEFEDLKRVLNHKLSFKIQTLLLLANEYPNRVNETDLIKWIEPSNITVYRRDVLRPLHETRMIDYRNDRFCVILPTGLKYIEDNFEKWSDF